MTLIEFHEKVWRFMVAMEQDTPRHPCIPISQVVALRYSLIYEENSELFEATSPLDALDAIADLLYVVHGAAIAYGFNGEQVELACAEVHRSNMSKFWKGYELPLMPNDHTAKRVAGGQLGDVYVVTRPDGKVIKSPSYSPANLALILDDPPPKKLTATYSAPCLGCGPRWKRNTSGLKGWPYYAAERSPLGRSWRLQRIKSGKQDR